MAEDLKSFELDLLLLQSKPFSSTFFSRRKNGEEEWTRLENCLNLTEEEREAKDEKQEKARREVDKLKNKENPQKVFAFSL